MIAIVATPSGKGYWLLASDGAVYSYGDAAYHGGAKGVPHSAPIVGIAAMAGSGYWLSASDGAVYHGGANAH